MKLDYWIRQPKPGSGRAKFSIMCRVNRGKGTQVKGPRIDAINKLYKEGIQDFQTCLAQVQTIVEELRGGNPEKERYLDANRDILDHYWKDTYERRTCSKESKRSRKDELGRAISAISDLDLAAAPINKLQERINKLSASKQRRIAAALNVLLKYCGRNERLALMSKPVPAVRHLTETQFIKAAEHLEEPYKTLAWVAFGTGCRFGEIFGIEAFSEKRAIVPLSFQRKENWDKAPLKNKKPRQIPVISSARSWVKKWLNEIDEKTKKRLREEYEGARIMRRACEKAGLPEITFHDLRHCYAMHLLRMEMSLTKVARALGNSLQVCQEHYSGFVLADDEAEDIAKAI